VLWVCIKLPQEYWIHIAQRDFTDTVADHPWVGVVSLMGILALVALFQLVARPRMPAVDHGWNARAAALPPAYRERATGFDWPEVAEKTALLGLISIVFAEILPDVETSALEVAIGVFAIVCANTAISLWLVRLEFPALLVVDLGLIFALSRFFTAAENFPLGTALFFAFLISLLISLYDRYKPVHDARFATAGAARPAL